RVFFVKAREVSGGASGFGEGGPVGVEWKKTIREGGWGDMVRNPPLGPDGQEIQMVGVDCALIMNPKVWEASGHVGGFADQMVDCRKCRKRFRADKVFFAGLATAGQPVSIVLAVEANDEAEANRLLTPIQERLVKKKKIPAGLTATVRTALTAPADWKHPCPMPDCDGELTAPRAFNLMFETYVGAVRDEENKAYLRPETAQGIFANFKNVLDSSRLKLPF